MRLGALDAAWPPTVSNGTARLEGHEGMDKERSMHYAIMRRRGYVPRYAILCSAGASRRRSHLNLPIRSVRRPAGSSRAPQLLLIIILLRLLVGGARSF